MNSAVYYIKIFFSILTVGLFALAITGVISKKKYIAVIAYLFIVVSTLAIIVPLIILLFILFDVLFHAEFGYPAWSILPAILLIIAGYMMLKGSLFLLRRARQDRLPNNTQR